MLAATLFCVVQIQSLAATPNKILLCIIEMNERCITALQELMTMCVKKQKPRRRDVGHQQLDRLQKMADKRKRLPHFVMNNDDAGRRTL